MAYHKPIEWTDILDRRITSLYQDGVTIDAIGKMVGMVHSTVSIRLATLGLRRPPKDAWPEEHIELLKSEWEKGTTSTAIAEMINRTKNSVIGKAHRLKLSPRAPSNGSEGRPKKERPPRVRNRAPKNEMVIKKIAPRHYPEAVPLTTKPPIGIMELNSNTCHAPAGFGPDGLMVYCGDFTFWDARNNCYKPFCEGHCAMFYQPPRERVRR